MAIPRTLAIDVFVVGQQNALDDNFSVTATYVETSSMPAMPGLVDAVTGTIDLDLIKFKSRDDKKYDRSIFTTFTLRPYIFDRDGNPVHAIFATPTDTCGIFLLNPKGIPPKKAHMWAAAINDVQILLYNKNFFNGDPRSERTYSYALGIFLVRVGESDFFISLDPSLLQSCPPV